MKWATDGADGVVLASHEDALWPLADSLFPDGGVFLDAGAHMGLWSVRLAARASRVYAVEPNPATAAALRENIALNGLSAVVTVLEVAAWDEDADLVLVHPPGHEDPRSGWVYATRWTGGAIRGCRLDGVLGDLGRLDLVKIDTEGADIRALTGMAGLIRRCRPVLIIESHHDLPYGYPLGDLLAAVAALGYHWEWGPVWPPGYHQRYLICRPS